MSDAFRDIFKNEVIRASAGTGKTFELSNRFLQLLASGVDCETILATTFTRKGAGEILDRIVQRLSRAAMSKSETEVLAKQLEWKLDQSRVQDLLRELIQNLHRLQIGTLDAFFYRIAQSFRLELGLPTQWQIVNERQIAILHNKIIHEILHDKSVIDVLHLMTKGEAQRRIADLIRATVDSLYEIRKQSNRDAWNRLNMPRGFSFGRHFIDEIEELETIEYGNKTQLNRVKKEVDYLKQDDWLEFAKISTLVPRVIDGDLIYQRKPLPKRFVEIYQLLIEHCRGVIIDMLIRKNSSTFDLLDKFGQQLEHEKTETGQLRFDDITVRLQQFIFGRQTDEFAFRLDHQVNHLLLDEFQDTSIAQWSVIEPFAARTTREDDRKSFFCVGDLKQAIFGWRGGVAEIFDTVECNLSNMAKGRHLTKSYRSSQVIIDSVNAVFGNLNKFESDKAVVHDAVNLWSERFDQHQTARKDLTGYFALEFASDSDIKDRWAKNDARNENTLNTTVDRIKKFQSEMPDCSIGVLVRKNETINELIFRLREAGISASEEGGNALTDSAAVETILALVKLADHPGDSIARFQLSHSPLAQTLSLEPETRANQKSNANAANQTSERLRQELTRIGYGFTIEKYSRFLAPSCTKRELLRLQQLVQEAFNYEKANDGARIRLRPARFVDHIRKEFKASDESSAQVRVMTIHQSKGLEFDVVVLPMFYEEKGWFSHNATVVIGRESPTSDIDLVCRLANQNHRKLLPKEFQDAFNENEKREAVDGLCVLYVAMTRAVHATHIIMSYGCKPDHPSNAGVVLATLHPGDREEGIVYSLGDQNWYQNRESEEPATVTNQEYYLPLDATISTVEFAPSGEMGRGTPRVSPSNFEGGDKIRMSAIFNTIENEPQLNRGTAIHTLFEQILWLDETVPSRSEQIQLLESLNVVFDDHDEIVEQFSDMIEKPALRQLLTCKDQQNRFLNESITENFELRVQNERSFAVHIDDKLMNGTIDRLVLVYEDDVLKEAEIIDFKTDDCRGKKLPEKVAHYRPQLEAYRLAVSSMFELPIEKVNAKLAFVGQDKIIDLFEKVDLQESHSDSDNANVRDDDAINRPNFLQQRQLKLWSDD